MFMTTLNGIRYLERSFAIAMHSMMMLEPWGDWCGLRAARKVSNSSSIESGCVISCHLASQPLVADYFACSDQGVRQPCGWVEFSLKVSLQHVIGDSLSHLGGRLCTPACANHPAC